VLNVNPAWNNGATAGAVAINLGTMTGFAGSSSVSGVSTNGNLPGALQALEIRNNGDVVAHLDSGDEAVIGKIALATFPSAQGLKRVGDTDFQETEKSGQVSVAAPGSNGRGTLRGSALENSTTDPANEFVSMIRFQRGYQAGSQVISTVSQLLDSTIQIA
jgi:flagellar hook protein FlgE